MELEGRLVALKEQLQIMRDHFISLKGSYQNVLSENSALKEEVKELKSTNFEMTKKIELAEMANQLRDGNEGSEVLKSKLDKYIREVDVVIKALKNME